MKFQRTPLQDVYVILVEAIKDKRGFFGRVFDSKIFTQKHLENKIVQSNISYNKQKGTLRGMHYQKKPFQEIKFVRCTKGKIFDVVLDLRPNSKTYKKWYGIELSADNHKTLYVPKGFAHGFITLTNNVEVFYQVSQYYNKKSESGIRWNDPAFNIKWPLTPKIISKKDSEWPYYVK